MHGVVISVSVEGRTVAIVRSPDGAVTFGVSGERFGVGLTDFYPYGRCVGDRLVVAGCVPSGAARVTVIDDAGEEYEAEIEHGLWLAIAGRSGYTEPLVRFHDGDGALLAVVPEGSRVAVEDADECCPVCDAVAWVQITTDETGIVNCEACGFGVGGIGIQAPGRQECGASARRGARRAQRAVETQLRDVVAQVGWPVYVADGRTAALSKTREDAGRVIAVEIRHATGRGELICVSAPDVDPRRPIQSLSSRLERFATHQDAHRGRSHAAILIGIADIARGIRRQAARAQPREQRFDIEGVAEPFEYLAIDRMWGAQREHDGIEIVLLARDVDPASVRLRAGP